MSDGGRLTVYSTRVIPIFADFYAVGMSFVMNPKGIGRHRKDDRQEGDGSKHLHGKCYGSEFRGGSLANTRLIFKYLTLNFERLGQVGPLYLSIYTLRVSPSEIACLRARTPRI
jgi:hypothetical protein